MKTSARWTVTVTFLAFGLTAAVVGPVAADELVAPDATQAELAPAGGDGGEGLDVDGDGPRGGPALENRRGHGHAFGLTARPADGGGLARGHDKTDRPERGGPADGTPRPDKGNGPPDGAGPDGEPGGGVGRANGTGPDHSHGNGKAPGHTHGTELGVGHTHPLDDDDAETQDAPETTEVP